MRKSVLEHITEQVRQKGVVIGTELDLDGVIAVEALRRHFGLQYLPVEQGATGRIVFGRVNVGVGDPDYRKPVTVLPDGTVVIEHRFCGRRNILEVLRDDLGVYVPPQAVEMADPNKVGELDVLDWRNTLNLTKYLTPDQLWDIAEGGLLGRSLTDEEIDNLGLRAAAEKRRTEIENAVARVRACEVPGTKAVVVEGWGDDGERVAFALGYDYYVRINRYPQFGVTGFEVVARPGKTVPDRLVAWARAIDGAERAGISIDPGRRHLVVGEAPHLGLGVRLGADEVREKVVGALAAESRAAAVDRLLAKAGAAHVASEASEYTVQTKNVMGLRLPRLRLKL